MFKLLAFKVTDHPQLGSIEFSLVDESERNNRLRPYTSVIIGPNGTGKSFILRTIADIFVQLNDFRSTGQKEFSLPFGIHLRYKYQSSIYEIISNSLIFYDRKGQRRSFHFFKNRPIGFEVFSKDKIQFSPNYGYDISINDLAFPSRVIVSSLMLNDRFSYHNSSKDDFYQYLGVRSTSSSSSTRSYARRTIANLFSSLSDTGFINKLKDLLTFLNFELSFKIHYKTKINKLFFSSELNEANFKQYFENWWDSGFQFSNRKKDNPLWSVPYYKQHFKDNDKKTKEIIRFLNVLAKDEERLKTKGRSKYLEIDLLDKNLSRDSIDAIQHLENLDIINLDGIRVKKADVDLSVNDISSGEYHLLISLIGMFAKMEHNSLILIDEPEISLHPNWQMRYITFLKAVFKNFSSCHFIITTHSHFLVSDLEGDSSSIVALNKNDNSKLNACLLENKNTFGWSAEEVLYNVFNVKTTRNLFLEGELRELLHKIATKAKDYTRMRLILKNLSSLQLPKNDPLNLIINKAEEYLNNK